MNSCFFLASLHIQPKIFIQRSLISIAPTTPLKSSSVSEISSIACLAFYDLNQNKQARKQFENIYDCKGFKFIAKILKIRGRKFACGHLSRFSIRYTNVFFRRCPNSSVLMSIIRACPNKSETLY